MRHGPGLDDPQQALGGGQVGGRPAGPQRGGELGLALQDDPVGQDLQAVGGQGRPGGGDVDDQLGGARRRGPLGGARRFGDPVVGHPVPGEEGPGLDHVLGGHPHAPAGAGQHVVRHLLQVGHGLDIEPASGDRHHEVGAAEPQGPQQLHPRRDIAAALTQQVLPGDPQMGLAGLQGLGDVPGREQAHLHPVHALQLGQVAAGSAGNGEFQSAVGQPRFDLLLEPALGGDRQDQGLAHTEASATGTSTAARRGRIMQPTARAPAGPPSRPGRLS